MKQERGEFYVSHPRPRSHKKHQTKKNPPPTPQARSLSWMYPRGVAAPPLKGMPRTLPGKRRQSYALHTWQFCRDRVLSQAAHWPLENPEALGTNKSAEKYLDLNAALPPRPCGKKHMESDYAPCHPGRHHTLTGTAARKAGVK